MFTSIILLNLYLLLFAMKVLVTGGSGFLGINLVRSLINRGYEVRVLDIASFDYPEKDRIQFIKGDIRDMDAVDKAVKDVDVVVHGAATLPLYSDKEIMDTNYKGTFHLLDAARHYGVERFIYISSTAVYGIPDHHPLKEDDMLIGVGPYGIAKIKSEKLCEQFRSEGMCISVIRPKSFIGPDRLGIFALFYSWAMDAKHFPLLGKGKNMYQLLDVEDLCDAIHLCITKPRGKVNDVFNIGAEVFSSMKHDFQAVLNHAGFGRRIIMFPAAPAILALKILELFKLSPLYAWVYETAAKDSYVSIEKAKEQLGFAPKFSNKQALIRNYEWYRKHRCEYDKKTGVSHRIPWKEGALKLIKLFF